MKLGIMENGIAKQANGKKRKRRRRNPSTAAAAKPARRRNVSLSTAKSVLKKNGLKAVSTQANGRKKKRRKHRRNGLATVPRRSNGFFGNTKNDATQVLQLGAGAVGVKMVGSGLQAIIAPWLARVGLGNYAGIITDAGLALVVAPYIADKVSRGSGKMVRLGGLLTVALDGIEIFAPGALPFGFNASPIVMTGAGAAVAPAAVAQIANDVANSSNPAAVAAKVSGAMYQLEMAGAQGGSHDFAAADGDLDLVL